MATEVELAYAAGVVDGEGCIQLQIKRAGNLVLRLGVTNTNQLLTQWLQLNFGGWVVAQKPRKLQHKPYWNWRLEGQKGRDLLVMLLPYLVIKQPQAALGIKAWDSRSPSPRGARQRPPAEVVEQRAGFVELLHEMNKKGVSV